MVYYVIKGVVTWHGKMILRKNIKCGLVEFLILALLTAEGIYGYRIKTELAVRTNNAIIVKEGSLYGPLYRMEQRKLISSRKELV